MKVFRTATLSAAFLGVLLPIHAAIAPGASGDGELFFNVYDTTVRVSYAFDTGVRMGAFHITGQPDGGTQRFWVIDDRLWTTFLGLVTAASLKWSLVAIDSTGPWDATSLFTTVRQGDEGKVKNMTNIQLASGTAVTTAGRFFDAVNSPTLAGRNQSTHTTADAEDYGRNGSSYSLVTDADLGYYGKTGDYCQTTTFPQALSRAMRWGAHHGFTN